MVFSLFRCGFTSVEIVKINFAFLWILRSIFFENFECYDLYQFRILLLKKFIFPMVFSLSMYGFTSVEILKTSFRAFMRSKFFSIFFKILVIKLSLTSCILNFA